MRIFKIDELNTLSEAREAYVSLVSAYEALLGENTRLSAEHQKASQEAEALRGDLGAANEMLDEAGKDKVSLTAQIDGLKTTLSHANANLEARDGELTKALDQVKQLEARVSRLESEAKSAEARAAQICASVGVDPATISPNGEPKQQSLVEQMRAIQNPAEQMAFFRKNKEAILKGQ